jgi:hypothetical protein
MIVSVRIWGGWGIGKTILEFEVEFVILAIAGGGGIGMHSLGFSGFTW